jgi:hypothetical protein
MQTAQPSAEKKAKQFKAMQKADAAALLSVAAVIASAASLSPLGIAPGAATESMLFFFCFFHNFTVLLTVRSCTIAGPVGSS